MLRKAIRQRWGTLQHPAEENDHADQDRQPVSLG